MTNPTMARSKLFIFSSILPFLLIIIALHKQHQLSSSLRIELDQLKSRVSVLESIIEKSDHELRSMEEGIAQMEKMILEKKESIASQKNKIDSIQEKESVDAKGQMNGPHSQVVGHEKQEWIPILKNQLLTSISNLKPHLDILTAKTTEAYHASKNTSVSFVAKVSNTIRAGLRKRLKDFLKWCLEVYQG